jgi:mono/diheme cytochrome c family protein
MTGTWPPAALCSAALAAALVALPPAAQAQTTQPATPPAPAPVQSTAPAPAQSATPPAAPEASSADSIEAGRKLYISSCQRCHGINLASNGIGYDLRTFPQHDKERFVRSVNNGVRAMPGWAGSLKPGQLDLLWLYIGSVNGWKLAAQHVAK